MPYVQQLIVTPTNATTIVHDPNAYSSIVGGTPQWGDDSVLSYARIVARVSSGISNDYSTAATQLDVPAIADATRTRRIAVWVKAGGTDPTPYRVGLSDAGGSSYRMQSVGFNDTPTPTPSTDLTAPAGWVPVELEGDVEATLTAWNTLGGLYVNVSNGIPAASPPDVTLWELDVYEVRVVIYVEAPSVAPPCRLFPREDGLGVGGGRHFPPAKSQQRSGRRFGYY